MLRWLSDPAARQLEAIELDLKRAQAEREEAEKKAAEASAAIAALTATADGLASRLDTLERPARRHRARCCEFDGCGKGFAFGGRHHCRKCGGSVCSAHFARPVCHKCLADQARAPVVGQRATVVQGRLSHADSPPVEVDREAVAGTWKCVSVEGDMGAVLKEHGYNMVLRGAARAVGFGAGGAFPQVEVLSMPGADEVLCKQKDPVGSRMLKIVTDGEWRENPMPFGGPKLTSGVWLPGPRGPFDTFVVTVQGSKPMVSSRVLLPDNDTVLETVECAGKSAQRRWQRQ